MRKSMPASNVICIGDQITLEMDDFGKLTATAQKVLEEGIVFLFDDIIAYRSMNRERTNKGSFEKSDMKQWLYDMVLPRFPKEYRIKVKDIGLPTYGEIFGHQYHKDIYNYFVPDEDKQFKLMKQRPNRIRSFRNEKEWWWLRNATKKVISSTDFASVSKTGDVLPISASSCAGVRPEFLLSMGSQKGEN